MRTYRRQERACAVEHVHASLDTEHAGESSLTFASGIVILKVTAYSHNFFSLSERYRMPSHWLPVKDVQATQVPAM